MKKILSFVLVFITIGFGGFYFYTADYYKADDTAQSVFSQVDVKEDKNFISIVPDEADSCFVFYPGGKVEPQAYLHLAEKISQNNIAVKIAKMPFNLAVLDMNKADKIDYLNNDIKQWYIGGHSLGGAMAATYIAENYDKYNGLVLLGAYSTTDLKENKIDVLSITATNDNIMNWESYRKYFENMPEDMIEVVIEGGCHSYFGNYGMQEGDGTPQISREQQLDIVAENIVNFISDSDKM